MAYYQVEPFGEEREDLRAALICQTMANINRGKNTTPFKLDDFMLFREVKPPTAKAFKASLSHRIKKKG